MFSIHFKTYVFLIQFTVFYYQCNFVLCLIGPNVTRANENEFPALVSIMRVIDFDPSETENFHRCTGTLVSKQDVLTAEHCLRTVFVEPFKVLVGSHDLRNATEYSPMYTWTYEEWALFKKKKMKYSKNDIAFVKLIGNIPDHIEFAPTGNIARALLFGMDTQTAGWGQLNNGSIPRYLHKATLKVLTSEECEHKYFLIENELTEMLAQEICTIGEPYVILGFGDSGGPLFYFGALVGINSGICPPAYGNDVEPYHLNMHISIRDYFDFVQDMIHRFPMNF